MAVPKVITFRLSGVIAALLKKIAHRSTDVGKETKGHRHALFSLYLTKKLSMRDADDNLHEPEDQDPRELTLWIVLPRVFHEWVCIDEQEGTVHDLTPLHQPHTVVHQ